MVDLILTEEEKKSNSYLDWDDASIGRLVKYLATRMEENDHNDAILFLSSAALIIINHAHNSNADDSRVALEGVTVEGKPIGDWVVEAKKLTKEDKIKMQEEDEEVDEDQVVYSTRKGDNVLDKIKKMDKINEVSVTVDDLGDYRNFKKKKLH